MTERVRVIFLDIDGVLNDHAIGATGYCGLKPSCVAAFNRVLEALPEAKIVISSSWRYIVTQGEMTLKGFEYLLIVGGVCAKERIIGATVPDEVVKSRGGQIARWLHGTNHPFVILDDMEWNFKEYAQLRGRHIKTDPGTGLTEKLAAEIINLLRHP